MPATKSTPQERKAHAASLAVAKKIAKLRKAGTPWDGEAGIVRKHGLCNGAPQGRALLRKHGLEAQAGGIAPSYERTPTFRSAESQRRQDAKAAKAKPQRKPRKRAAADRAVVRGTKKG